MANPDLGISGVIVETLWSNLSTIAIPASIFVVALVALLISKGERAVRGRNRGGGGDDHDLVEGAPVHRVEGEDLDSKGES